MTVPSLALPDEQPTRSQAAMADAVRLFVDRAHTTRSEFVLSAENAAAVTQLCRRLDGIPLAIDSRPRGSVDDARRRSPPAWTNAFGCSPAEPVVERIDIRRFAARSTGPTKPLEPAERTLLARLSVCLGGFDLPAAEAIGAGDDLDVFDIDDLVGRLVDKSLVLAADQGEITRYKMLETIREYALDRLDASGETASIRTRHAAHYTEFAQQGGAGLKGPHERAWLTRVEDELDNLRAAVTWSLGVGRHPPCLRVRAGAWSARTPDRACRERMGRKHHRVCGRPNDPAFPVALAIAGYAKWAKDAPPTHPSCATPRWHASRQLRRLPPSPAASCHVSRLWSPYAATTPKNTPEGWLAPPKPQTTATRLRSR